MKKVVLKNKSLKKNVGNYIQQHLINLGIAPENVSSFTDGPQPGDELSPRLLDNMEAAAKLVYVCCHTKSFSNIFVQVDSDTDGYTSSSILIRYLSRRFPNCKIHWRLHKGKEHGVIVDTVPEECELVIIPDAGSNQAEEHKQLVEKGKIVVILDHHEVNKFETMNNLVLVNNQTSENFSNKNLSGAGVVYKFIQMMDELFFEDKIYTDYADLAAVGIIADVMDMRNTDNNAIACQGLNNIQNGFLLALMERHKFRLGEKDYLTRNDVAFYIAPTINGTIRGGSAEDKEYVFRSMAGLFDPTQEFAYDGKFETFDQRAVRLAANAKSRQDAAKKKAFEWISDKIRSEGLDADNIIIVPLSEKESLKVSPNITGLIAMELTKEFNKPCLVLRDTEYHDERVFGGSGRNGEFKDFDNLLNFLHESNVYYAEGHANAFGAYLTVEDIENVRKRAKDLIDPRIFDDTTYEVDYWFHTGEKIDLEMLWEFSEYKDLWLKSSIPAPLFAIDTNYDFSQVMIMGKKKDCFRLKLDGVDCVALTEPDMIEELRAAKSGHITIIGEPAINEYMGRRSVQFVIEDIAIVSDEEIKNTKINIFDLI